MKNKRLKKFLIKFGIILLCLTAFIIYTTIKYKQKYPGERTEFASIEEFEAYGGHVLDDIPESASDFKYYYNEDLISRLSICSFVIEDEAEYEAFVEAYSAKFFGEKKEHPVTPLWEYYGDSYTEEELEEMAYLEEHYYELDYKEILSMSRHKFGFFNGYGAKVGDYTNMSYSLAEFPINDRFKYVEEGSIEDYTILYYYPQCSGSRTDGVIVDEENRKFIIYNFSYIR
ncbi:MAG: hypothetical protein IJ397_01035 [Lachnospiraceae bacterium]|nr:hypothetical protein [Lachnospiraceae bacterium]